MTMPSHTATDAIRWPREGEKRTTKVTDENFDYDGGYI
jgi:hypothetical protein